MFQTKFETLQKYIKNNLISKKIKHSMIDVDAFVFFVFFKNDKFRLCVDYRDLNVVIIKNKISLSLINETLNRLMSVAYFTKFDFQNVYHTIKIREKK